MKMHFLVAALAIVVSACSTSQAAIVSTVLTFDAPSASINRLNLALTTGTTTSDVFGTISASLNIDTTTGVITAFELNGGSLTTSDWTMTSTIPPAGAVLLTTTDSVGTGDSFAITGVTGTSFDATQHFIDLTGGVVTLDPAIATPVGLDGTEIPGIGAGTITSTLNGGVYDIVFSMDIDDTQFLNTIPLTITGSLLARGQVTAVPEPTSAVALAGVVGVCVLYRRRKRSSNAI